MIYTPTPTNAGAGDSPAGMGPRVLERVLSMILKCSGRKVLFRKFSTGGTEAYFADGSPMTSAEWNEYADRVAGNAKADAESRAAHRRQQNRRAFQREANMMRFFGLCSDRGRLPELAGLSPDELHIILVADAEWSDNCARGRLASEACDLSTRLELAKKARGNVAFWYGVAESTPAEVQIGGAA